MAGTGQLKREAPARHETVSLGSRAEENLQFIRETMERSTSFTAVPGYGGMLMGATAVGAAFLANAQATPLASLAVWLAEAVLAFAIGMLSMWQKSKIAGQSLVSAPARKFAMSFAPPLLAGVATVLGLFAAGHFDVLAPAAMISYGAAIICGGAFSVRVVPVLGWCFMVLGAAAFALPAAYSNAMMGLSFGLLHIIFGAVIARRYGG